MATLLFARHGQASFGKSNYDNLSDLGTKQAALLGSHYAQAGRKIDAVVSGSLVRQKDSATHFLKAYNNGLKQDNPLTHNKIIENLNEFNHKDVFVKYDSRMATEKGTIEAIAGAPVPKVRLSEMFNEAMLRWHSGNYDPDYLESWTDFNQRVQGALHEVMDFAETEKLKTVLVFTSGGVIAAITSTLLKQASSTAYQINRSLVNTGVTSINVKDNKPRLLAVNEHTHLYKDGERFLTWH